MIAAAPAKRAFVTGGASGIGAAIVRQLVAANMAVTFCDIDAIAGEVLARTACATFIQMDATDTAAVEHLFAGQAGFAVLVNNVGLDQHAFLTQTGADEWRRLLAVNLETAFAFTKGVLPAMQAAGYGRIVTISSEAGRLGSKGGAVYAAAKAGLVGFTRSVARENARYGITANAVLPGPIRTPMVDRALKEHGPQLLESMASLTLLRRLGTPDEVAAAAAFLCSPEAGFITGEALGVSGGMGCGA